MSPAPSSTDDLRSCVDAVRSLAVTSDDSERIDRLRLLEELKAAASAVQMTLAVEFDASQRAAQRAAQRFGDTGPKGDRVPSTVGRGVAAQMALALRRSPWATQRWLSQAQALTHDLPCTFVELSNGRTTEWRALLVARETSVLSRADRFRVDSQVASQLAGWGDRRVEGEARKAAYRLDPAAAVKRASNAVSDRRVSIRPAPDTMCRLTALLPVAQGVAAYAALSRQADTSVATGDGRGRGQIMADTLVERITGQTHAPRVPVEINLVMSVDSLLGRSGDADRDEPAVIPGYGPIPAAVARELVGLTGNSCTGMQEKRASAWIRRLFTSPDKSRLIAMESHRRRFTTAQQAFVVSRDQHCRTPWCDAPIRHIDHVRPHESGGSTTVGNAQGLCEACNYAKQAPGWHSTADSDSTIVITTPTRHRHLAPPPGPPGSPPPAKQPRLLTAVEQRCAQLLAAAA